MITLTQEEQKVADKFHSILERNMKYYHKWWTPIHRGMDVSVSEELNSQVMECAEMISVMGAQTIGYYGLTILHQLVAHNYYDCVKILLKKGVPVDVRGGEGKGDYTESHKGITPLHLACYNGNLPMVQLLLEYGADASLCDAKGRNCLHFVACDYYPHICYCTDKDDPEVLRQLMEIAGIVQCDINQKDVDGVTPFLRLMQNKDKKETLVFLGRFQELGADVTVADDEGNTALIYAVERGHLTATEKLAQYPQLVNARNHAGDTPLHKTFGDGAWNPAAAYLLVEHGGDISIRNQEGKSIAEWIKEKESESHCQLIIKCLRKEPLTIEDYFKVKEEFARDWWGGEEDDYSSFVHGIARKILRKIDKDDDTELLYAKKLMDELLWAREESCQAIQIFHEEGYDLSMPICEGRHITTLRDMCLQNVLEDKRILPKLKELGVDINAALVEGRTMANMLASRQVEQRLSVGYLGEDIQPEDVKILFAQVFENFSVASMEALNNEGKAAIHLAAENNSFTVIRKMAEMGVNVNLASKASDEEGDRPLHLACKNQCVEAVKALVEAGAFQSLCNEAGETPAHSIFSDYRKFDSKKSFEIIKILDSVDETLGQRGGTPFLFMLQRNPSNVKEFTEFFLQKGVNVNQVDDKGNTPLLIHAHRACDREVMKLLLQAGADINARNQEGNSALIYALKHGYLELARYLIKKGADYNIINEKGETPASIAQEEGYDVVLELMTNITVFPPSEDEEDDDDYDYDDDEDFDDEDDDDDEEEEDGFSATQYHAIEQGYIQMYGEEKGKRMAELSVRMGEMNMKGLTQSHMDEYMELVNEFQKIMGE